jgi:hypothetical protein
MRSCSRPIAPTIRPADFGQRAWAWLRAIVASGGHSVPAETVARRYGAGSRDMFTGYLPLAISHWLSPTGDLPLADVASLYDNAGEAPILMGERESGGELVVHVGALGAEGKNIPMAGLTPRQPANRTPPLGEVIAVLNHGQPDRATAG